MVECYCEHDGDRYLVAAKGHATGNQDVCAGVSTLISALYGWLINNNKHIDECEVESGDAVIRWRGGAKSQAVFDLTTIGLLQLAETEPDYISADYVEIT